MKGKHIFPGLDGLDFLGMRGICFRNEVITVLSTTVLVCLPSFIQQHGNDYVARLSEVVAIKSVSAWPESRSDVARMMNWMKDKLIGKCRTGSSILYKFFHPNRRLLEQNEQQKSPAERF